MRIGQLARRTGVPTKTIRYYEEIGVLPAADRSANGYRDYGSADVERLRFVRDAQATGLSLAEITSILELRGRGESSCEHVVELLGRHLADLDRHIVALQKTRRQLASLTERARGLDPSDCRDPNRCQTIASAAGGPAVTRRPAHVHEAPTDRH